MDGISNPLDFSHLAPAGHYVALRVGFIYPMVEYNALPAAWVQEYTSGGLMVADPVLRWVYATTGSIRWSAIEISDPRGVMQRARSHGLNFGAAVAVMDEDEPGLRSFGSFARADREFDDDEISEFEAGLLRLHRDHAPPKTLTRAELEVLRMVKDGLLVKEIAGILGVTEGAVKQRLKNAKVKLGAKTSTQAATMASEFGLV
jgi:LuxR family transcriptional regulator